MIVYLRIPFLSEPGFSGLDICNSKVIRYRLHFLLTGK